MASMGRCTFLFYIFIGPIQNHKYGLTVVFTFHCFMGPTVNLNNLFLFEENLDGEIDPKRYSDNEELRFLLRSIER